MIQHRPQKIVFSASVTHLPCPYKVRKQTLTSTTHLGTRSGHRDDNDLLKFFNKNWDAACWNSVLLQVLQKEADISVSRSVEDVLTKELKYST